MSGESRPTTASGAPVDDDQNALTAGPREPALMQDPHLMGKLAHFDRERIGETGSVDMVYYEVCGSCWKCQPGAKGTRTRQEKEHERRR